MFGDPNLVKTGVFRSRLSSKNENIFSPPVCGLWRTPIVTICDSKHFPGMLQLQQLLSIQSKISNKGFIYVFIYLQLYHSQWSAQHFIHVIYDNSQCLNNS